MSHESVRHIFEDAEGNLWLGTEGGGLNVLSPRTPRASASSADGNPAVVRQPWPTPRVIIEELWADSRLRWENPSPMGSANTLPAFKANRPHFTLPAATSVVEAQYTALNF